MSSIPGIDSRAPERTETSSGSSASPSRLPACSSSRASASATCSSSPSGSRRRRHVGDAGLGRDREARPARARRRARGSSRRRSRPCRRAGRACRASPRRSRRPTASPTARAPCTGAILCRAAAARSRTCAWCSTVSRDRPLGLAQRALGCGRAPRPAAAPSASTRNAWASSSSGKADASHALHTTPPAAPEKPPRCSRSPHDAQADELRREPGGEQQLEPEGELVGARRARPGRRRAARARCRAGGRPRGAGRRSRTGARRRRRRGRGVERRAPSSRRRAWAATVSALGDREQVAAALVEHEAQAEERLQAPAEAAARAPHALGDRADAPAVRGVEMQDAVGLAVADRAQHDGLGLQRAGTPPLRCRDLASRHRLTRRYTLMK